MKNYIITEDRFEVELISRLLPIEILINTKIISAGGYSSGLSLAKSLLEKPENISLNIVLILDSDTIDEVSYIDKSNFIHQYIGNKSNFKLILFKPKIEVVFFESEDLLSRVTKDEVTRLLLLYGKSDPLSALELINVKDSNLLLEGMMESDKKIIMKHECFVELINFLKS